MSSNVASRTADDTTAAYKYATIKMRQEQIRNLKMEEPNTYAFINIKNLGVVGWKKIPGILVEPGQKITPFYDISYDSSKLKCENFSCIMTDVGIAGGTTACSFSESSVSDFPLYDQKGNELTRLTACGRGCYIMNKRRNPMTGEPSPLGNLLADGEDAKGNKICRYLNQRLILWAGVPSTRPVKGTVNEKGETTNTKPYNPSQMPPFAFDEKRADTLDKVLISEDYCSFFKRYFDADKGDCYRTGWMKFVHFTFGEFFTNVTYEIGARPRRNFERFKTMPWYHWFTTVLGGGVLTPFYLSASEVDDSMMLNVQRSGERVQLEETGSDSSGAFLNASLKDRLPADLRKKVEDYIDETNPRTLRRHEAISELVDKLLDLSLRFEALNLNDEYIRTAVINETLNVSRNANNRINEETALRFAGLVLAFKHFLFSDKRPKRRQLTEREALILADKSMRSGEVTTSTTGNRPKPFIDVLTPPLDDEHYAKRSNEEIFRDIIKQSKIEYVQRFAKNFVVNFVRGIMDVFTRRFYDYDHYYYSDNIALLIVTDVVASKMMRLMVDTLRTAVTRFSANLRNLETGVRMGTEEGVERVIMTGFRRVAMTAVLEEGVVRVLVRSGIQLALSVFVRLAALAADLLAAVDVVLIVGTVLGIVLDLALKLSWYDQDILTNEVLQSIVAQYTAMYEKASGEAYAGKGVLRPIGAEDIVSIAISLSTLSNGGVEESESYSDFLAEYFNESPLLRTSKTKYLDTAMYEYMASRTMNSYGQPIRVEEEDDATATSGSLMSSPSNRMTLSTAASQIEAYSKLADYNADRAAYADIVGELAKNDKEEAEKDIETKILYKRSIMYAGIGSFMFVMISAIAAGLYLFFPLRVANISLSFAFVGLLVFVTFMSIAFLTVYDIGNVNSLTIKTSKISRKLGGSIDNNGVRAYDHRRGFLDRLASDRTRLQTIKSTLAPLLEEIEASDT